MHTKKRDMQELKIKVNEELADNQAFSNFLKALPRTFNYEGTVIHSGRNVLRLIEAKGFGVAGVDNVMVKRYRGLFWFQKLDYTFFREPKCRKAFDNTAELRRRGFDAARELAVVEVWNHGLFQYAFFVSEVAKGVRLDDMVLRLQDAGRNDEVYGLIHQFAAHLKSLHEHGIFYNDMNCGNVICSQEESNGQWHFCFVDTNRVKMMTPYQPLDLKVVLKDILLMNPKLGTVELFQEEYLKQRGLYTPRLASEVREIQRTRYEKKKHRLKNFFKYYKKKYYQWLGN